MKKMNVDDFEDKVNELLEKIMDTAKNNDFKLFLSYAILDETIANDVPIRSHSTNMKVSENITNLELLNIGTNIFSLVIEDIEANIQDSIDGGEINFEPEA